MCLIIIDVHINTCISFVVECFDLHKMLEVQPRANRYLTSLRYGRN